MENDSTSKEAYLLAYHACIKGGKLTVKGMVGLLKLGVKFSKFAWRKTHADKHGKQSLKKLIRKDQGVTSVDVSKTELRDFQRVARKYGVDFAIVKHLNEKPPVYSVFFKAKDQDAKIFYILQPTTCGGMDCATEENEFEIAEEASRGLNVMYIYFSIPFFRRDDLEDKAMQLHIKTDRDNKIYERMLRRRERK